MATDWLMPQEKERDIRSTNEKEELFVFGYACKIFRDDEKAMYIEQGSHLIPWMGDERLQIDRYDGRGHLYDLTPHDASHKQPSELTPDEKRLEELCDEERYLELHTDVAEKKLYEEEEWKRYYESLSEGYNAVGFSYDHQQQQAQYAKLCQEALEEEKPFQVPKELQLPPNIVSPDTEKQNAIIEKTARFVAKQGAQMEILMKTKQASNPTFSFLHFEDELNPYYKHMVIMIKSGKYKPHDPGNEKEEKDEEEENDHHGYLHPSLMAKKRASPAPEIPSYKSVEMPKVSIHDTPYGQLIKSLVKKHNHQDNPQSASQVIPEVKEEPPTLKPHPYPSYYQEPMYGPSHSNVPPPPGIEPVTLPTSIKHEPPPPGTDTEGPSLLHRQSPVVMEDCESRDSPVSFDQIIPPPPDVQPVIDRMAMYVAKNGIEFEIVVKSKNDPRFEFLQPYHVHFPYYDFKKQIHMREAAKEREKREAEKPAKLSFSIKAKTKEETKKKEKKKKKVFDNEDSDNEVGGDSDRDVSSTSGTSTPIGSDCVEDKVEKPQIPQEERDRKKAEERLKDKLAQAAREKLAQASREKQMQAERKRKAAMFINMLKSCNTGGPDEEKLPEDVNSIIKEPEKSTPSVTPGCSPYYGPLERNKSDDAVVKKVSKKSKHKDRRDRSRSRSPRKRRRRSVSRSVSPKRVSTSRSSSSAYSPRKDHRRSRSRSSSKRPHSPSSRRSKREKHSSSKKSKKKRISRSRSRSPKIKSNMPVSIDLTEDDSMDILQTSNGEEQSCNIQQQSLDTDDNRVLQLPDISLQSFAENEDSNSGASDSRSTDSQKNVSSYMRERVRAIIKASREAVMKEEGPVYDDT